MRPAGVLGVVSATVVLATVPLQPVVAEGEGGHGVGSVCVLLATAGGQLSSGASGVLERLCSGPPDRPEPGAEGAVPVPHRERRAGPRVGAANFRVNDPVRDLSFGDGTHITQSEVSVVGFGTTVLMAYNDSTHFGDGGSVSFVGYSRSTDGGRTWADMGELGSPDWRHLVLGDPVLAHRASDGSVFLASVFCTNFPPAGRCPIALFRSTDGGVTFAPPAPTWPSIPPGHLADKEWMAVDNGPASPYSGRVYVSWTTFRPTGGSSIMLAHSDDGAAWATPVTVSDPSCAASQGSQVAVGPAGRVYVTWLCATGPTERELRFDASVDGGATWGSDRVLATFRASGDRFVDCGTPTWPSWRPVYEGAIRANDFPSLAVDSTGRIFVAHTADPDGPGGDDAAVFLLRSADGGQTWSPPAALGEHPNDQFFPMVQVGAGGTVGVAWYDRRDDPANLAFRLYLVVSDDGGETFRGPHRISTERSRVPRLNPSFDTFVANCYMGDYNAMVPAGSGFLLGWGDTADPGPPGNFGVDPNVYAALFEIPACPGREAGAGNHIVGTPGADRLVGTPGPDVICGLGGDDVIWAGSGSDLVMGGRGADEVRAGGGGDVLLGHGGPDLLFGGGGPDELRGGSGLDALNGGLGVDVCHIGPGGGLRVGCP